MEKVVTEVTPLKPTDCFYMKDRYKDYFNFPLHRHTEMELNFVENCEGARRVVGDSAELLGPVDLVIIGPGLSHAWEQHDCRSTHIREITLQFSPRLLGGELMGKTAIAPIQAMLDQAGDGLVFGLPTVMRIYSKLMELTVMQGGFYRILKFMEILHDLAVSGDFCTINSPASAPEVEACANQRVSTENRVETIRRHVREHYRSDLRLSELAGIVGMSPSAFSRFFKTRTGRSITDYVIDCRIAHASRELIDTQKPVAEICLDCGFNSVSNFNRIFKKKKGSSPNTFRQLYQRLKAIV